MSPDPNLSSPDLAGWPLEIKISGDAARVTVAIRGEIDVSSADEVDAAIRTAEKEAEGVVVDLSDVSFLDSTGLRVLLQLGSHDKHHGPGRLSFIPSEHAAVKRMLALTGISEFLS